MAKARIFYYCCDHQRPSGGQKTVYRHVDILNHNGFEASVVHRAEGYSLQWFPHNTRIICLGELKKILDRANDVVVLPEDMGHLINEVPGQNVICNQGCYIGFAALGFQDPHPYPYLRTDVKGVMVVSDHNLEYLSFVFPNLKIRRVRYSVNPDVFISADIRNKKRRIACLPSKNPLDVLQIYHISRSRAAQALNRVGEYEWVFIQNMTEQQVAETLRESLVFIFLNTQEGFGLLPVEAMLCGDIVLGYRGGPLTEYLRPDNSYTSEPHDTVSVVKNLEQATTLFLEEPERLRALSEAACKTAREYSYEREEKSVLDFWKEILRGE